MRCTQGNTGSYPQLTRYSHILWKITAGPEVAIARALDFGLGSQ
jgi:hypothetical protein